MINDLLRDMIEAKDMVVFIDNIMVGTKTEEEHNEIVEEVLKRIAENVKSEKYV